MGGHGWTHVMLWVGIGGHRSILMGMVWVWYGYGYKFKGKYWALIHSIEPPTIDWDGGCTLVATSPCESSKKVYKLRSV
jgi:hypothetical protein